MSNCNALYHKTLTSIQNRAFENNKQNQKNKSFVAGFPNYSTPWERSCSVTAGHAVSNKSTVLLGKACHRRFNLPGIKQKKKTAQIVQNCKISGAILYQPEQYQIRFYSSILQCIIKNQDKIYKYNEMNCHLSEQLVFKPQE
jgi:hypothetical protein